MASHKNAHIRTPPTTLRTDNLHLYIHHWDGSCGYFPLSTNVLGNIVATATYVEGEGVVKAKDDTTMIAAYVEQSRTVT